MIAIENSCISNLVEYKMKPFENTVCCRGLLYKVLHYPFREMHAFTIGTPTPLLQIHVEGDQSCC